MFGEWGALGALYCLSILGVFLYLIWASISTQKAREESYRLFLEDPVGSTSTVVMTASIVVLLGLPIGAFPLEWIKYCVPGMVGGLVANIIHGEWRNAKARRKK